MCKTAHKLPHILKLLTKRVMKARILALALIVIMLSSPSISLADRNTIPYEINEVNAVEDYKTILSKHFIEKSQSYVSGHLTQ